MEPRPLRILVVDDDAEVRLLLHKTLLREGFEVTAASDGESALEQLRRDPHYDLVITDLRMPGIDGEEVAHEVRENFPGIKVLLITGYADMSKIKKLVNDGLSGFIMKPFKIPDLLDLIEQTVQPRQRVAE